MVEDAPKPVLSDMAVSDMFVPVDVRSERAFRIVGVDHAHIFEAQRAIDFRNGLLQPRRAADIVAGCQAMAGVDAESDLEIDELGRELAHHAQFLESAPQGRAGARRVFEQHRELARVETLRRFGQRPDDRIDALLHRVPLAVAGVRNQVFGADRQRTLDLAAKRRGGLQAQRLAAGRQIDQVVVVDDQRKKIVPIARPSSSFTALGAGGDARHSVDWPRRSETRSLLPLRLRVPRFNDLAMEV